MGSYRSNSRFTCNMGYIQHIEIVLWANVEEQVEPFPVLSLDTSGGPERKIKIGGTVNVIHDRGALCDETCGNEIPRVLLHCLAFFHSFAKVIEPLLLQVQKRRDDI